MIRPYSIMPLYKCILFQHYSLSWKTYCLHHKCQCLLPFLSVQICIHVSMCMYLASPLLLWLCVSVNEYAFSFSYLCQLVYLFSLSLQMQIYGWVFLRLYLHVYIQGVSKKKYLLMLIGVKTSICLHQVWPNNPVKATWRFYPQSTSEKYLF